MLYKTCSILQPHYMPWIGYFNMISRCNIFVFLDDVEYTKGEWKNRNLIRKTYDSNESKWLSISIDKRDSFSLICNARTINSTNWREIHLNKISNTYNKTEFFNKYFDNISNIILDEKLKTLADLNIKLINYFCKELDIDTKKIKSSELNCPGDKHLKPLNICKKLLCENYLANDNSSKYLKTKNYQDNNINIIYQNFTHPHYDQFHDNRKISSIKYLSIIDLLFNQGQESKKFIK